MKNKLISMLVFLLTLIMPFGVLATDGYVDTGSSVTLNANHSTFSAGESITLNGSVKGISFAAGNSVTNKSSVEYGAYAGNSVNVSGIVEKDLFAAGNVVRIDKDAIINRDIYIAASTIDVAANSNGNLFLAGSIVKLENVTLNGDVNLTCGTLEIVGDVTINGTLYVNDDAVINNESALKVTKKEVYKNSEVEVSFDIKDYGLSLLSLIFAGILLALIFPKLFKKVKLDVTLSDACKNVLLGLLFLIVVPVAAIMLIITMVGSVFGIISILFYIIALMIATILSSYVLGNYMYTKLFKQQENIYVSIIIGILVIKVIGIIPYLGGIVTVLTFMYGLGIVVDMIKNRNE